MIKPVVTKRKKALIIIKTFLLTALKRKSPLFNFVLKQGLYKGPLNIVMLTKLKLLDCFRFPFRQH